MGTKTRELSGVIQRTSTRLAKLALTACLILSLATFGVTLPPSAHAQAVVPAASFTRTALGITKGNYAVALFKINGINVKKADLRVGTTDPKRAKVIGSYTRTSPDGTLGAVLVKSLASSGSATLNISSPTGAFTPDSILLKMNASGGDLELLSRQVEGDDSHYYMKRGATLTFKAYLDEEPAGDTEYEWPDLYRKPIKKVKFSSSNKQVATVNAKGKVHVKQGARIGSSALITAKSGSKVERIRIKVVRSSANIRYLERDSDQKNITLIAGTSAHLEWEGEMRRGDAAKSNQKTSWSSSKKSVAKVNAYGIVTAKKKGTAKISLKVGSKKISYQVKVVTVDTLLSKLLYQELYDIDNDDD